MKKFYMGAKNISDGDDSGCFDTLQQAVNHAKEFVEMNGGKRYVVKIVAVVEESHRPVQVKLFK